MTEEKNNLLGLTQEEQIVMDKLLDSYTAFLALPKQHPNEIDEFVNAVHLIQGLLATRIVRRGFPKGWPTYNKSVLIDTLLIRFDAIINGKGLVVPRVVVKAAIEELKNLSGRNL